MKLIIGIYLLIGVIFSPFIYSNNGGSYISRGAYGFGQSFGKSIIFWPSYVLAWEPEINGDSDDEFVKSIFEMKKWRQNKWFSTAAPHEIIILSSIGYCGLLDAGIKDYRKNIGEFYEKTFKAEGSNEILILRKKIRDRFDGMDFKDVIAEGNECRKKIKI